MIRPHQLAIRIKQDANLFITFCDPYWKKRRFESRTQVMLSRPQIIFVVYKKPDIIPLNNPMSIFLFYKKNLNVFVNMIINIEIALNHVLAKRKITAALFSAKNLHLNFDMALIVKNIYWS